MGEVLNLLAKTPVGGIALILGVLLVLFGLLGQFTSPWVKITLVSWQRIIAACIGVALSSASLALGNRETTVRFNQLPVREWPLVEQDGIVSLDDAGRPLFVRAVDIHRLRGDPDASRRFAEIEFDTRADFLSPVRQNVYPKKPVVLQIEGRTYRVGYVRMGQLEASDANADPKDLVLLSVERAQ